MERRAAAARPAAGGGLALAAAGAARARAARGRGEGRAARGLRRPAPRGPALVLATRRSMLTTLHSAALILAVTAQAPAGPQRSGPPAAAVSELRDLVDAYALDRAALLRRYPVERSPQRVARLKRFYQDWRTRLAAVDFERLGLEGRLDPVLLRNEIENDAKLLARYEAGLAEVGPLVPFAPAILALNDSRLAMETLDPATAATALDSLAAQIESTRKGVEAGLGPQGGGKKPPQLAA